MIDASPIFKIVPIFAAALIAPGPDFMMISSMAMSRGRKAGLLAALGISAAVFVYVTLCIFGLGVMLAQMHWLVGAIRVLGGLYLIYLGFQLWRRSFKLTASVDIKTSQKRHPFLVGFLTNMTNPKAIAFFTSVFALTLPVGAGGLTHAAIVLVMCLMPIIWFSIVTFCLSAPAMRLVYLRSSKWIDRTAGSFLGLFGVHLLFSRRN